VRLSRSARAGTRPLAGRRVPRLVAGDEVSAALPGTLLGPQADAVTRIRTPSSPTVDDINRIPDEGDEGNDSRSYEISISPM
jgi:hypothetical protein